MVSLFYIVAAAFFAASCSNHSVDGDADADLSEASERIEDFGEGDFRDVAEDAAEEEQDQDVPLDVPDVNDIPSELEPLDCVLPIRECGSGCRQVTCAGVIYWSYAWDVSESYVAYFASKGRDVSDGGLNVKDLDSGVEWVITGYPDLHDDCNEVVIEGPIIAYRLFHDGDTTYCQLSLRWIDTRSLIDRVAFCYASNPDGENFAFGSLDIYSDIVVWYGHDEGESSGIWDLFMFDLTALRMTRLTYYDGVNYDPKIWERNIVYERWSGGSYEIFVWDLDTGDTTNLTGHPSDQWDPDIWQNRVVWTDCRNGTGNIDSPQNTDIYWCELPYCAALPATANWASQMNPTTGGDWIVWIDYRNAEAPLYPFSFENTREEIWGYNISTGEEHMLFSCENTVIRNKLRIENGKLYFLMAADPACLRACDSAVFELDLSQFL